MLGQYPINHIKGNSMNKQDRATMAAILLALNDLKSQVENHSGDLQSLADAEQEKFDNMPEGLQAGEQGQKIEAAAEALSEAAQAVSDGNFQEAIDALEGIEG